jgi:hypothetical protein
VVAANPVAVYTAWGCEPLASLCAPPSPDAKCCVDFAGSRGGQDLKMSRYFQQHFFDGQVGASPPANWPGHQRVYDRQLRAEPPCTAIHCHAPPTVDPKWPGPINNLERYSYPWDTQDLEDLEFPPSAFFH